MSPRVIVSSVVNFRFAGSASVKAATSCFPCDMHIIMRRLCARNPTDACGDLEKAYREGGRSALWGGYPHPARCVATQPGNGPQRSSWGPFCVCWGRRRGAGCGDGRPCARKVDRRTPRRHILPRVRGRRLLIPTASGAAVPVTRSGSVRPAWTVFLPRCHAARTRSRHGHVRGHRTDIRRVRVRGRRRQRRRHHHRGRVGLGLSHDGQPHMWSRRCAARQFARDPGRLHRRAS